MKKLVISALCCAVLFGGYYVYKNKNSLYQKYKNMGKEEQVTEKNPKFDLIEPSDKKNEQLDDAVKTLAETVDELSALNKKMEQELKINSDSIFALNSVIDSLNKEIASRPKIKIQSSPYSPVNNEPIVKNNSNNSVITKNNKPKNEKNPLIARGNDAVKLKEFFTDRYDHRR
ncbi:MAG: hypothetical protein RLZ10_2379 [Bacteroidota bacterium]|jgi:hypothetical protein